MSVDDHRLMSVKETELEQKMHVDKENLIKEWDELIQTKENLFFLMSRVPEEEDTVHVTLLMDLLNDIHCSASKFIHLMKSVLWERTIRNLVYGFLTLPSHAYTEFIAPPLTAIDLTTFVYSPYNVAHGDARFKAHNDVGLTEEFEEAFQAFKKRFEGDWLQLKCVQEVNTICGDLVDDVALFIHTEVLGKYRLLCYFLTLHRPNF